MRRRDRGGKEGRGSREEGEGKGKGEGEEDILIISGYR